MVTVDRMKYWHLMLYLGFLPALWWVYNTNPQLLLISILVYVIQQSIGFTAGFHRYISHRSFETSLFWERVMATLGCLCSMGSPVSWSWIHRYHHQHSDTKRDIHSPKHMGWIKAFFCLHYVDEKKVRSRLKDVKRNSYYAWLDKRYFPMLTVYMLCLSLFGVEYMLAIYWIPAVLNVLVILLGLDIACHVSGYRNHMTLDASKNNWIVNLLTLGDGWHNNHHNAPDKWDTSEHWWEWDPTARFISLIRKQ